jgi:hypothetical protein
MSAGRENCEASRQMLLGNGSVNIFPRQKMMSATIEELLLAVFAVS